MSPKKLALLAAAGVAIIVACAPATSESDFQHFHPKGKPPSEYTLAIFDEAKKTLPFEDRRDFEEWERGYIAGREELQIMADAGNVAWDMERYQFLNEPEKINSVHPSLLRVSQLNMNYGLYEVIPGIYQVRGFDLAQLTFIRGKTGWIAFDPLTAVETARAAKELLDEHVEELPVVAVVYSHSHGDHFGGVRGLVNLEDVRAGKVEIIAPRDFMDFAVESRSSRRGISWTLQSQRTSTPATR
jgi:alkyl sulfatase BDS1-like metallo-beta-lactamase superfamily hydrolase